LRFHDLRHHAITELAESRASDATIMAIAGHVSRQMLEHYSHVRLDLKRKALDGLAGRRGDSSSKTGSYDTSPGRSVNAGPPSSVNISQFTLSSFYSQRFILGITAAFAPAEIGPDKR
jgi:hypothetical protein